ncbi:MAG TPA: HAD hydrolase family protein [Chlamydiales bacterium]|nr:HAD hydrolase family protein [Chlamydiales bacterium]
MRGWIVLDIDGTMTNDPHSIPSSLIQYLKCLEKEGWQIALATGRTCRYALMALSELDIPYILMPQNGSAAVLMPEKKALFKRYLPFEAIAEIEELVEGNGYDFILYLGFDQGDRCYFRKKNFPPSTLKIMQKWQEIQKEKWNPVDCFTKELIPEFAAAKVYAPSSEIEVLGKKVRERKIFQVSSVRDPSNPGWSILFITHPMASKGKALEGAIEQLGRGGKVICAGDDENDLSLFEVSDFSIAMAHAPELLLKQAKLIADSDGEDKLIAALRKAIKIG